ncbi:MCE family protein [Actinomadura sp. HBU206391]|uniref:MCE family protein n=1 Tax=Actinomadura sp. HBU206391 TaxID=2731692 RepID=UPI00164F5A4C|nr:MCE family protein [Actinomadura sp. HBU206391]MBC6461375.1 MCE family protein [Actinomadura sp. HBU206391]
MTKVEALPGGLSQRVRYRLYGIAFVLVVALLLALTAALFNKTFTPVVRVKVNSDRAGLQLLPRSDVKVRGLIVGEVRGTRATANGAQLDLALDPDKAHLIPGNVQARMLPKTLFGEKYVDLVLPAQRGAAIRSGAVIAQDRSTVTVEVNQVLDHLLPLLQAVKPEKLNATLNALATALQGRGDQLGHNLEQADSLLKKVNPKLGTLVYDLRALSEVSDVYDAAAPDLLQTLRNLNVTGSTIVEKKAAIEALIPAVTEVSDKGTRFAQDNGNKIVGVNIANRQALELVAKYSPSFPCVLAGLMKIKPRVEDAVGGKSPVINLTVEIVKPRPAFKSPLDLPEYKDHRNPRCYGLPNPKVPFPDYIGLDGTEDDTWWKAGPNGLPSQGGLDQAPPGGLGRATSGVLVRPGAEMTEQEAVKNVVAPLLRTPAGEVSDLAALLFGPLTQGSVVTVG